ncbi:unnamed protein product [Rotaria sp. Silwood1]|nr:unnamed protein product [Rotaria sp. Silwood1]
MPFCAEKSVICLLYYLSSKLVNNPSATDSNDEVPDPIETNIYKEFEHLKERLKIEELESKETQSSINRAILHVKNKNWNSALLTLRKIFKEISPLDIQETFRLIEKVDDAAKAIEKKEIILLLGGTGSGKSTTIHFLGGSKMIETRVDGLNHIAPTNIINRALIKIETAPFTQSVTRYMAAVEINFEDVGSFNTGSIWVCDSPGFEDTSGPEVDIANGLGMIKAIKGCKSVRPVILFSYKSIGDRCGGVKKIAHLLVGLIPGIQYHKKCFTYIFTKFPENEKDTVHALINDVNRKLNQEEKSDTSFMILLRDILTKTKNGARVLDPMHDKPADMLDEFFETDAIHHPEDVFKFSIAETSKSILHEQVRKHQLSIMSSTNRYEYSFVEYKLTQLNRFKELLNQDSIEQVYTDCIRYISRHMSDEYQAGISALNRCLMNQTVLTDEDIQQYKTCIEHAKLAEKLKNKDLETDIIHSCAFMTYLNQQIKIMFENLHEKDIDDTLVRDDLQKIKFLSDSFSHLDSQYQDICQHFVAKLDNVVVSFKSSVLSNEFNKSAIYITKVYASITILHDHLNQEEIKAKYKELEKYFLNYLNDSVEKIKHSLTKEKLDKDSLDSLDRCVTMLENAKNTFDIQSHISKEEINNIYENLLSKIMIYFERKIQTINTTLKNENAFESLEQNLIDLDSIRRIPIINEITTEFYCICLEKIIRYVYEARRDVENLLKKLFQQDEDINYDKLTKCLFGLKNAKWIERYRSEIYSDIIKNVEEQIIQHVKQLKDSIMIVKLDLHDFSKINGVSKLIAHINAMKSLEKIVPNIVNDIASINTWFKNVTENVFIIIESMFNIEKWKKLNYQSLDFNKIEKAFSYLDACKEISSLSTSKCMPVLSSLEDFIRCFSTDVQQEIESSFEKIKNYEDKNEKDKNEEIFKNAQILSSRLQQVSEIKPVDSRILSCFSNPKLIEQWKNKLGKYSKELSIEMEELKVSKQIKALNIKLLVARALSRLDDFLKDEKISKDKRFIEIYSEYKAEIIIHVTDVCKKVIDAIKTYAYEEVCHLMNSIDISKEGGYDFLEQAKRALNTGLKDLMEETKIQTIMLGNNIEIERIKSIIENLKRIGNAKQFTSQYLVAPNEPDEITEEVKQLMAEQIKRFLESVNALLTVNNFSEADKRIDSITLVPALLGKYCDVEVAKQIEGLRKSQKDVVLKDIVKIYSEMDIISYHLNPPTDIFAKFHQVNSTNNIYNEAATKITNNIFVKFRKELDDAKSYKPPNLDNIHIRKFEIGVKYLPEGMRVALETELKNCKDYISLLLRDNDLEFDRKLKSGDLNVMKNIFQEYRKMPGIQEYIYKARESILKQVQDIVLHVNQNFEQQDIRKALDNVKKLYNYKIELVDNVSEINQSYLEIQSLIKIKFDEAYSRFMNRFLSNNTLEITEEIIEIVLKSFISLIEFMKFRNENINQSILIDILPKDFDEKLNTFSSGILEYFKYQQKTYKDALEVLDIQSLKTSLETIQQWNSLFVKMKTYDNLHNINDESIKTIVKALTELTSYANLLDSISQKIEKLGEELMNQELIDDQKKEYIQHRDEFYKKLNEKYSYLNKAKILSRFSLRVDIYKIEENCLESLKEKIMQIYSVIEKLLERIPQLTREDYENFNLNYVDLVSFKQEMKVTNFEVNKKVEKIEKVLLEKIEKWQSSIASETTIENIATILMNMKSISNNILLFKTTDL